VIVGVGVDLVDLARFEQKLADTPALLERLFTSMSAAIAHAVWPEVLPLRKHL